MRLMSDAPKVPRACATRRRRIVIEVRAKQRVHGGFVVAAATRHRAAQNNARTSSPGTRTHWLRHDGPSAHGARRPTSQRRGMRAGSMTYRHRCGESARGACRGRRPRAGQQLLIVEAMKMESPIRRTCGRHANPRRRRGVAPGDSDQLEAGVTARLRDRLPRTVRIVEGGPRDGLQINRVRSRPRSKPSGFADDCVGLSRSGDLIRASKWVPQCRRDTVARGSRVRYADANAARRSSRTSGLGPRSPPGSSTIALHGGVRAFSQRTPTPASMKRSRASPKCLPCSPRGRPATAYAYAATSRPFGCPYEGAIAPAAVVSHAPLANSTAPNRTQRHDRGRHTSAVEDVVLAVAEHVPLDWRSTFSTRGTALANVTLASYSAFKHSVVGGRTRQLSVRARRRRQSRDRRSLVPAPGSARERCRSRGARRSDALVRIATRRTVARPRARICGLRK